MDDWGWDLGGGSDEEEEPRYDFGGGGIDYGNQGGFDMGGGFGGGQQQQQPDDGFQGFGGAPRGAGSDWDFSGNMFDRFNDNGSGQFDAGNWFKERGGVTNNGGGMTGGPAGGFGSEFGLGGGVNSNGIGGAAGSTPSQVVNDGDYNKWVETNYQNLRDYIPGMGTKSFDSAPDELKNSPFFNKWRGQADPQSGVMPGGAPNPANNVVAQQQPKTRGSNEWWDTTDFGNGQAAYDWMPDFMRNPRSQEDWVNRSIIFQQMAKGEYRPGNENMRYNAMGERIGSRRNPQQEAALFQQMMGGRMPQGGMQQGGRIMGGPGGFQPNYAANGRVMGYGQQRPGGAPRPQAGGGYRPQQRYSSGGGRSGGGYSNNNRGGGNQQQQAQGKRDMFGVPNSPEWRENLNRWYEARENSLRGRDWVVGGVDPTNAMPTGADSARYNTPWGNSNANALTRPGQAPLQLGADGYWYATNPNNPAQGKKAFQSSATYIPAGSNTPAPLSEFFKWKQSQQQGGQVPASAYSPPASAYNAPAPQQRYVPADEAPMGDVNYYNPAPTVYNGPAVSGYTPNWADAPGEWSGIPGGVNEYQQER
jgi:hypothetical protein